uniref:Glycosyl transferase, group 1 n=1 Tax=Psychrobacter sp. (strain PRwf-1) TaxID=349106 RepID=A5WBZ8_PSYWF
MKIIIIGTVAASFYGFRAELIRTLIKNRHQVYAYTTDYREEDLVKIKQLGANPIPYKLSRGGLNPFKDIYSTLLLAKSIKTIEPDVVFSYFSKPVIFGTLAAKLAKTPKVIGMLEGLGYVFTDQPQGIDIKTSIIKKLQVTLYRISLPRLDTFILLNHDDPIDLLDKYNIKINNIEVLGGIGLDLKKYPLTPIPKLPVNFIFIARLLKEKGIFEFIEAAKKVKQQYPSTKFTVLGAIDWENPGALKQYELDKLIELNLVEYPGHVDNIQSWIASSHVFVLPSYREGLPRSTQEAMAMGRPVITTDVPGCRETAVNGLNGFIVERWNSKALEEKMIYFIENPDQIEKMGLESYKMAQKKFDAEKTNQKLLKILGL